VLVFLPGTSRQLLGRVVDTLPRSALIICDELGFAPLDDTIAHLHSVRSHRLRTPLLQALALRILAAGSTQRSHRGGSRCGAHHSGAKCDLAELLRVLLCEQISGHNGAIPRCAYTADSSPRWTLCNTVCRATPSAVAPRRVPATVGPGGWIRAHSSGRCGCARARRRDLLVDEESHTQPLVEMRTSAPALLIQASSALGERDRPPNSLRGQLVVRLEYRKQLRQTVFFSRPPMLGQSRFTKPQPRYRRHLRAGPPR
jgi:hypothetical protein